MALTRFILQHIDRKSKYLLLNVLFTNIGLSGLTLLTGILIYDITGSLMAFAFTLVSGFIIDLAGQFFAGGILDRINPNKVSIIINLSRGLLIIIAGLIVIIMGSVTSVIFLSLFMSLVGPAYRASVFAISPLLVNQKFLSQFNAFRVGVMQVGQLIGLGLATLVLALTNQEIAFTSIAIWFLLGALMMILLGDLPLKNKVLLNRVFSIKNTLLEWKELFLAFKVAPSIYFHILISSSGLLIASIFSLLIVPLNEFFQGKEIGYLILDGGFTVGAILASLILSKLSNLNSYTYIVVNVCLLVSTVSIFILGYGNIILAGLLMFVIGISTTSLMICLDSSLQIRVGNKFLGRTALFQDMFMSLISIIFVPIIANTMERQGIQTALNFSSLVLLIYLIITVFLGSNIIFGKQMFKKPIKNNITIEP
ncbi:MFS transporter [Lysinibacillus mangiferihumi]|uniref:MFS transporter n=1 Tax=Lysinibacillus mangiferihumi TaxID=1130819 RepID=A0A4U2YHH8_9BACI|nr:MFS transporter [Lysinibacillus mangiferihumi]TKI60054.1 MFS transporter [Lysinibacillus mangiferihumi]